MHRNVEQVTKEEIQKSFQLLKFSKFSTTHGWIYYLRQMSLLSYNIWLCYSMLLSIQWYIHVHIHNMTLFFVIQWC